MRLFLLLPMLWAVPVSAVELRLAVASNFLVPARVLVAQFEQEQGHQLKISSGSTGKLYAQIVQGAPYDLFLAANGREPERLVKSGIAVDQPPFTYAVGRLVLWSANDTLLKDAAPAAVLQSDSFHRLALANPRTAPYGAAALSVLSGLGLEQGLAKRMVRAESVAQAYQYVATGNAELGFISQSQLLLAPDADAGSQWPVPDALYPPIRQQAVVLKRSQAPAVARAFLAYLGRADVREKIAAFGYGTE